ncbi:N-acetylgalactosamine-N,N'-diacetylbacillosaminyl-diphospho-undecaprenol 4-alpha-N-acetylgalactosaminyltransferase [Sulfitobacter brevis]|uniref:N-acetylgalactosamine-N,N'-diacetylbacillosaminyl-diphospho-undecaprenol 4-alpha-N-acetylgalactosaminyltransferase n=1 Tax=Sulfitobacter brevis TaxID=74348 RepID=A0A1I2FFS9_9RHOB|nr:glycosyltransferase [Sulfitobacter brevis]SFF03331.1 N-acetylgalactosamine-N,N'-diacetylbacillosaminyl-diphospho-undecaprenol 4-alpha-N-acetylgalactosaminyltransferase [Sulfitobacter brevis]
MVRRLLLLINSLEGGGAEKVFVSLAAHFARTNRWELCIATLDDVPDCHLAPPDIKRVRFDCRGSLLRSVREVGALISRWQPDVVLSFLTRANCAAVLARGRGDFRCVISERVNTTSHMGNGLRSRLQRALVRWLYPRADTVIAVSEGVGQELQRRYHVPADRITAIPNPVFVDKLQRRGQEKAGIELPPDFFVAVGRLVPNKANEVLLRAFAAHANKDRALIILGEGAERPRLEALAETLGLEGRLHMPGYIDNPQAIVARATAYVSASRSEGFPNALIEAMSLGRPVISTDCHSGPAEILAETATGRVTTAKEVSWGILTPVDDIPALTEAMDMMDMVERRDRYAVLSRDRMQSYAPPDIFKRYEGVLS